MTTGADEGPYIFLLSWERPIYLWVALDSLYRNTKTPCRFVLIDNGSKDPLVREVIRGFERRSMFYSVHLLDSNRPDNFHKVFEQYQSKLGPYFGYAETDITIEAPLDGCWLSTMVELFHSDQRLAMLGSYNDSRDFVDPEEFRDEYAHLTDDEYAILLATETPERFLSVIPPEDLVISPYNPPGRLLLLRTDAISEVGFQSDLALQNALTDRGWHTGISTKVIHRHLSWLHVYDHPDYDVAARVRYFEDFTDRGSMNSTFSSSKEKGPRPLFRRFRHK